MNVDFFAIAPELALVVTALLILGTDVVLRGDYKQLANPIAGLGALVALGFTVALWGEERSTFGGTFVVTPYAVVFKVVFALLAILGISWRYFAEGRYFQGEYYFLLVTSFIGMLIMPSARDMLTVFVALETVSIPGFVMAGLRKRDLYSSEASIKFFLIGVLSVALMLFGISLVYGFTGTTSLPGIAEAIRAGGTPVPLLLASVMLVIVGFAFKVSAVPFHFWAPDTYAGSPMPVAAMLAVASKAAGFAGLISVTFIAFEPLADTWAPALGVLAVLTMTLGNLIALQQRDVVRLLAYSSVAQAGYMLVPFGIAQAGNQALNDTAVQSVVIYLAAYAVMNIGAFGVVIAVSRRTGERAIADYAGLGSRNALLALGMTTFLLSLGGIPPMVGFWAKFHIFFAAVEAGTVFGFVLGAFVVVNSVIAMFYYLRLAATMWMGEAREGAPALQPGLNLSAVVGALAVATIVLGVFVSFITDYATATTIAAGG
jgi:NADH-quinone oxidoreductase subunit N